MKKFWLVLEIICLVLAFASACYDYYIRGVKSPGLCEIMLLCAWFCQIRNNKKE